MDSRAKQSTGAAKLQLNLGGGGAEEISPRGENAKLEDGSIIRVSGVRYTILSGLLCMFEILQKRAGAVPVGRLGILAGLAAGTAQLSKPRLGGAWNRTFTVPALSQQESCWWPGVPSAQHRAWHMLEG